MPLTRQSTRPSTRRRMIARLAALAPDEGYNLTPLPDVRLLRSNRPLARTPVLYEPGIVIVAQGSKRGWLGDTLYKYDAQHYLAVAVPVPFTMQTEATAEEPLLAIYLRLDFTVLAALLLELDEPPVMPQRPQVEPASMVSSPLDERLAATVLRLLEVLADAREAAILGPGLLRELYYRVLTGGQGAVLRAALRQQGRFGHIARAVQRIHADYARGIGVPDLAAEANMSLATFHEHFKTVTGTSPLQYLKSARLHQARLLMVREGMMAAVAATAVGYESASQFSREFRRLFGRSPTEEAARLRSGFALPPMAPSGFISSH